MRFNYINCLFAAILVSAPGICNAEAHQTPIAEVWYGNAGNLRRDNDQTIERLGSIYEISRSASAASGIEPDSVTPEGPRDALRHGLGVMLVRDTLGPLGSLAVWAASQAELQEVESDVLEWYGNSGLLVRRNLNGIQLEESDRRHLNDVHNNYLASEVWDQSEGQLGIAIGKLLIGLRLSMRGSGLGQNSFVWEETDRRAPEDMGWALGTIESLRNVLGNTHSNLAIETVERGWRQQEEAEAERRQQQQEEAEEERRQQQQQRQEEEERRQQQQQRQEEAERRQQQQQQQQQEEAEEERQQQQPGCVGQGCDIGGPARVADDDNSTPDIIDFLENPHALNEWIRSLAPPRPVWDEVFGGDGVEPTYDKEKLMQLLREQVGLRRLTEIELADIVLTSDTNGELEARLNLWLRNQPRFYEQPLWERLQQGWTDPVPLGFE